MTLLGQLECACWAAARGWNGTGGNREQPLRWWSDGALKYVHVERCFTLNVYEEKCWFHKNRTYWWKKRHRWSCSEATWTKCCCKSKQSYLLFLGTGWYQFWLTDWTKKRNSSRNCLFNSSQLQLVMLSLYHHNSQALMTRFWRQQACLDITMYKNVYLITFTSAVSRWQCLHERAIPEKVRFGWSNLLPLAFRKNVVKGSCNWADTKTTLSLVLTQISSKTSCVKITVAGSHDSDC